MNSTTWRYDKKATGERIARLLQQRGQKAAISRQMKLKQANVNKWTQGDALGPEVLTTLATRCGVSVDYILGLDPNEPKEVIGDRTKELLADIKRIVQKYETPARDLNRYDATLQGIVQRGADDQSNQRGPDETTEDSDTE